MTRTSERVEFRLIIMECCSHNLCWVNPRLPTFCPACSKMCYPQVRGWVRIKDQQAQLRYNPQASA